MAGMTNLQEVPFIPATSETVGLSPLQKVRSRGLVNLICRPSDNESLLAFVRTRTGGLIKRISTLGFIWLLVVFKRLEETKGPFYVPADCTNRFAYL